MSIPMISIQVKKVYEPEVWKKLTLADLAWLTIKCDETSQSSQSGLSRGSPKPAEEQESGWRREPLTKHSMATTTHGHFLPAAICVLSCHCLLAIRTLLATVSNYVVILTYVLNSKVAWADINASLNWKKTSKGTLILS